MTVTVNQYNSHPLRIELNKKLYTSTYICYYLFNRVQGILELKNCVDINDAKIQVYNELVQYDFRHNDKKLFKKFFGLEMSPSLLITIL